MWIDERTLHNPVLEVRADAVIDRDPSAVVAIAARKSFPHRRGEEDGKAHGVEAEQKAPSEDVLVDEIRGGLEEALNGGQVADTARHDPEGRPVPHPAPAEREPPPRREW
jgi:hypothetical protein